MYARRNQFGFSTHKTFSFCSLLLVIDIAHNLSLHIPPQLMEYELIAKKIVCKGYMHNRWTCAFSFERATRMIFINKLTVAVFWHTHTKTWNVFSHFSMTFCLLLFCHVSHSFYARPPYKDSLTKSTFLFSSCHLFVLCVMVFMHGISLFYTLYVAGRWAMYTVPERERHLAKRLKKRWAPITSCRRTFFFVSYLYSDLKGDAVKKSVYRTIFQRLLILTGVRHRRNAVPAGARSRTRRRGARERTELTLHGQ